MEIFPPRGFSGYRRHQRPWISAYNGETREGSKTDSIVKQFPSEQIFGRSYTAGFLRGTLGVGLAPYGRHRPMERGAC